MEIIAFLNDYEQLNETCLEAAGCTGSSGDTTNKGQAEEDGELEEGSLRYLQHRNMWPQAMEAAQIVQASQGPVEEASKGEK